MINIYIAVAAIWAAGVIGYLFGRSVGVGEGLDRAAKIYVELMATEGLKGAGDNG